MFSGPQNPVLGRFESHEIIGRGGESCVYKGRDIKGGQEVVIKELSMAPGDNGYEKQRARFERASRLRFNHPNLIDPIDSGKEEDRIYLIYPFINGCTLTALISGNGGALAPDKAVSIILNVAKGLQCAHAMGVIHRDVKEENILITPDGRVLLIDLTICRILTEQTITGSGDLVGTLAVMSPQHLQDARTIDERDDLYSAGVVFYRMLTGKSAATGNTTPEIVHSILHEVPPPPNQIIRSIPDHISQICQKLLIKDRNHRVQNAQELIAALEQGHVMASQCPACKKPVAGPGKFCAFCGANMNPTSGVIKCIACGNSVDTAPACHSCGRKFSLANRRLEFVAGALAGEIFRIPEGLYPVGRNEIAPRDYHISRKHLYLKCSNGRVEISDAGSANKTYIAGQLITSFIQIVPGQQLCLAGNTAILY